MSDTEQLLRSYVDHRCEQAFAGIVARHIHLVYSAALRQTGGNADLAQDITQNVFVDLARKAASLPRDVLLPGWLYRHTCFTAAKAVRTESRRRVREQAAVEMNAAEDNPEPPWLEVAPILDEAVNSLAEGDREAVVLRFFQGQEFQAVGMALGISEEAARKRVTRSLERLRTFFSARGVTVSVIGLLGLLASQSVVAAPAGLTATVTATSIAGAASGGTLTFLLLKFMTITKAKMSVVAVAVAALVAIPVIHYRQTQKVGYLARESWRDLGQKTPDAAFETYFWAGGEGNVARFAQTITAPEPPPGEPAEVAARLKKEFEQIQGVRVQSFKYEKQEAGFFSADWILQNGTEKRTRSKWRRVGEEWKLVNDEPMPPVAQKRTVDASR
jgi:RNA polymerase sigma factor (sigma-70 family)